ncbi:DUF2076 family protein [Massilia sp. Dwa41.01b]|uniref:DUF2076 family protein n=1 Tax=Massilia sp. Dwa41.01b TaxID=2709302 RepID=UPI001600D619|nr:DUF2076 family protein [Massilia sp. Dwa41.01b]QNA89224.1 DUF2076 family protein [Massilia sp. Dwa41.01b]
MSPQDSQLLQDFLDQLIQARGLPKDPEAEAMIQKAVAYQPDAAYLLVQRALLQQQALDNAKAEIASLQQQLQARGGGSGGGFLDPHSWGNSAVSGHKPGRPALSVPASIQLPTELSAAVPAWLCPGTVRPVRQFLPRRRHGRRHGRRAGQYRIHRGGCGCRRLPVPGLGNLLGNHDGNGFLGSNEGFNSLANGVEDGGSHASLADNASDSSSSLLGGDAGGGGMADDLGLGDIGGDFDGGSDDSSFG